jgi:hypothetical protein
MDTIKTFGNCPIYTFEEMNKEGFEPESKFTEIDEKLFLSCLGVKTDKESDDEIIEIPNELYFKPFASDWYEQNFPGFPPEWYDILEMEDEKNNKEEETLSDIKNKHYN